MLVEQSHQQDISQISHSHMGNQIRLTKKVLLKFAHLGIFIHQKILEMEIIQEISWNLIKKQLLITKWLQRIIINTDKIMMLEFHLVCLLWRTQEVYLYLTKRLLMEELIDHKLPLMELSAIVLERQLDKFCKLDMEISRISRNKQALKETLKSDTPMQKWRQKNSSELRTPSTGKPKRKINSSLKDSKALTLKLTTNADHWSVINNR